MRILLVNKYAHVTGGADRYCLALTRLLRNAGHEVRWLSTAGRPNLEHEGTFVRPRPGHAFWNSEAAAALDGELARFRPDVVHFHKLYPHLSVAPVVRTARAGAALVQTAHDYEFTSAEISGPVHKRTVERLLLPVKRRVHVPRIDRFVAPSQAVANTLASAGIESDVVWHFVEPRPSALGFDERGGVAFAGRLVPEKGIDDVLRLADELPELQVTVAGAGPLRPRVRASGVRYLGSLGHDRVLEELGRARVAVVPSRWAEPAGLVALEAMSVGTPIVAYPVGGLAEYVRLGGGVVAASFAELRDAVRTLHADRREWEARATTGLDAVRRELTPERHLAELMGVYELARSA